LITHFLGREEVAAYGSDFARRLANLKSDFPSKWFPIGLSGEKIAEVVYGFLPQEFKDKVEATTAYLDRKAGEVKFDDPLTDVVFDEQPILLIDSAVHSGTTMLKISQHLSGLGAKNIISYTLMLKRTSTMIPTYFGILVGDRDRVYFQLDQMPNNRLCELPPFGVLRTVSKGDGGRKLHQLGEPFKDFSLGDLLYDQETKKYRPYVYEIGNDICGLVSFTRKKKHILFIDAWATSVDFQGRGIGGAMMRWAETWGRSNKCNLIELWAFDKAVPTYLKMGYAAVAGREMTLSPIHRYTLMTKKILHNTGPKSH